MPQTLPNPAQQLSTLISSLYALSGDSRVPAAQQQQLLLQAHDLRGDLVTLVSAQFTQNTAAYQNAMTSLGNVTAALGQAQQDITKVTNAINGAAQLAGSIDALLLEAAKMAAI
jgi:hypothetical protein